MTHHQPVVQYPQGDASGGQEWYSLRYGSPELMFYCLQYTILTFQDYLGIHCLNFSYVTPNAPLTPPSAPDTPPQADVLSDVPPLEASGDQEQYYIR